MTRQRALTLLLVISSLQVFSQNCGSVYQWEYQASATSTTHSDYTIIFDGKSTSGGTKSIHNFNIICGTTTIYSTSDCYNTAPAWDPPIRDTFTFNGPTCTSSVLEMKFSGRTTAACGGTTCLNNVTANNPVGVPVRWLDFNASCLQENILIEWTTASEDNNSGFQIQQFVEGDVWENVGWTSAKGNSNAIQTYQFSIDKELNNSGLYRLKQIDYDGKSDYSKIATVNCNNIDVVMFPNPASDILNFSNEVTDITISNLYGMTEIEEEEPSTSVGISSLEQGIYLLQYNVNGSTFSKRLSVDRSN